MIFSSVGINFFFHSTLLQKKMVFLFVFVLKDEKSWYTAQIVF
jgi:hypothetical protein